MITLFTVPANSYILLQVFRLACAVAFRLRDHQSLAFTGGAMPQPNWRVQGLVPRAQTAWAEAQCSVIIMPGGTPVSRIAAIPYTCSRSSAGCFIIYSIIVTIHYFPFVSRFACFVSVSWWLNEFIIRKRWTGCRFLNRLLIPSITPSSIVFSFDCFTDPLKEWTFTGFQNINPHVLVLVRLS